MRDPLEASERDRFALLQYANEIFMVDSETNLRFLTSRYGQTTTNITMQIVVFERFY